MQRKQILGWEDSKITGMKSKANKFSDCYKGTAKVTEKRTVKWGNIVTGINIVTSLPKFFTGYYSHANELISLA